MIRLTLTLVLVIGVLSSTSQSLRFEIQSAHTKCIAEDIKSNSMTVGKYNVVNPNDGHPLPESHKLTVRVTKINLFFLELLLDYDFTYMFVLFLVIGDVGLWE